MLVVILGACLLVGCGRSNVPEVQADSVCVDIPNGQYFQFVDGRLVTTSSTEISTQERPRETERRISATLAGMGYPWVALTWDGRTATVSGIAVDDNSRLDAFIAAKSAFEADPVAGPLVERVINDLDVHATEDAIAIRLTQELVEDDGLDWLRVVIAGRVATLDGEAKSAREKEIGYSIGRSTVESDLAAGQLINIVVDAIQIQGQEAPIGVPLISMKQNADVEQCQNAFDAIVGERDIAFETNESIVKKSSSRVLDAVTGVALLCEAHDIEIAGHSGAEEMAADAIDLSQRRASSVRDYLMAYGVSPDILSARGYGRAEAIGIDVNSGDVSNTPNTAFIVRARDS